jgi:hypothetical protein
MVGRGGGDWGDELGRRGEAPEKSGTGRLLSICGEVLAGWNVGQRGCRRGSGFVVHGGMAMIQRRFDGRVGRGNDTSTRRF